MTENEAIKVLENHIHFLNDVWRPHPDPKVFEAIRKALASLEELQMYKQGGLCLIPSDVYKKQCEELDSYKEIGTVEELQELKEKNEPKKPLDGGEMLREVCPTCGRFISEMNSPYYCPCGQKLDWK